MKNISLFKRLGVGVCALLAAFVLHAGAQPKFTLVPMTPTTLNLNPTDTATVQYRVTNQTKITRTLTIQPIAGITQSTGAGECPSPFTLPSMQSCLLTLQVDASTMTADITRGPVVCKTEGPGNNAPSPFLCSQPSLADSLNIAVLGASFNPLRSIVVTPANPTIGVGEPQQFVATGTYANGASQVITTSVTWSSSNPGVATISNAAGTKGLAVGVSGGTTTITATLGTVSGGTTLTVSTSITATSLLISPADPFINVNTTQQFIATATFSDGSMQNVTELATWQSSIQATATVSDTAGTKGLATAHNPGFTTIGAGFGSVGDSTELTVNPLAVGQSYQGGIVACLGGPPFQQLIASNNDNSAGLPWDPDGDKAAATDADNGSANTISIIGVVAPPLLGYAAGLCSEYEIDSAGNAPCVEGNSCYVDWFFPAVNQLSCLYTNQSDITGFTLADTYWSSTQTVLIPPTEANGIPFNTGIAASILTTTSHRVRCVRTIT